MRPGLVLSWAECFCFFAVARELCDAFLERAVLAEREPAEADFKRDSVPDRDERDKQSAERDVRSGDLKVIVDSNRH